MANRYRVVRVRPNGTDWTLIQDFPVAVATAPVETEQQQREAALARARLARDTNGWRVRVYSPHETRGDQQADDLIWDSAVQF